MSVRLTVRDDSVTDGMKTYAREKAQRLHKFFDGINSIEVILSSEALRKKAEIVLSVAKGDKTAVSAEHEQMNAAIDLVMDRAERSVIKYKEKIKNRRGPAGGASGPPEREPDEDLESYQDIIEKTEFPRE